MNSVRKFKGEKGFTLVELMVVILIIGILVGIAIPVYNQAQAKAKANACKANLRTLDGAIQTYNATTGDYPDVETYTDLVANDMLVPDYIKIAPKCPDSAGIYTYTNATHSVTCSVSGHNY
ncbi:prepilin-type N-terminal cleavage/methylation domain-containing protein [Candidatus Oleimmundimicrobium sp.]|uniref:prepilin-type N-terminal cleavage/methylation domain-containing protein n=1 Tax=Candidatus Oleimmundimicrobium sp. TaxID=3060597 RepID=UPI0027194E18|nr:prepilin-type N-terminal cleavage/methylation domain-containing protein [Candidatus Oleimmundimicrobium sp.]MDO8886491.1 prepilin-type N-terminal cleavage/methylation domain-containing protein [Candidatus Oleimmundimicrobium sp.]